MFYFRWNPKTDHESIKSTLQVDSSDQIQIRIFEIHHLSFFWDKIQKKYFWQPVFHAKLVHNSNRTWPSNWTVRHHEEIEKR